MCSGLIWLGMWISDRLLRTLKWNVHSKRVVCWAAEELLVSQNSPYFGISENWKRSRRCLKVKQEIIRFTVLKVRWPPVLVIFGSFQSRPKLPMWSTYVSRSTLTLNCKLALVQMYSSERIDRWSNWNAGNITLSMNRDLHYSNGSVATRK